ncbi:MAG TPA: hypothetical protein VGB85_12950 [Nannocystis sp.]|jgi:hypothetical protein
MRRSYDLTRSSYLFLGSALALTLAACGDDGGQATETESGTSSTGDATDTDVTPTTQPTEPNPTEPNTTEPLTTSDTSTTDPLTTDPTTDTTTDGTTTDATTTGDTTTGDTTTTDTTTGDTGDAEVAGVWASANPTGLMTDALVGLTPTLDMQTAKVAVLGDLISVQSVGIDADGDAVISFDEPGGTGGIIIDINLADNPMNSAIGLGDRVIRGPATGLIAPKGVEAVGPDFLFLVADTGAMDIKAFDADDEGDVAPIFVVSDLGTSTVVWDIHYVVTADVLYAAGTNGEVQVYENFSNDMGQTGPDRTIVPTMNNQKISINLHGIAVENNQLFLSDVGDAMKTDDGQLFRIANASGLDGNENVTQRIQGGDLGNPVDIDVRPGPGPTDVLFVAEKSNDLVLVYRENVMGNFAIGGELAVEKPESVAVAPAMNRVIVAKNPAGLDTDAVLALNAPAIGNPTLTATLDRLGSVTSVQSLVLADNGDAYVGFDGPSISGGGGVFLVPVLTNAAADSETNAATAMRLWGENTGIVTPKGLLLTSLEDRLIVADTGGPDIKVFDTAALGDTAPLFVVDELGGGPVWDIAYDNLADRLYAAGTDGVVRVFDDFMANEGQGGPDRLITPTDDQDEKISVNLHGIEYDAASDTLILSDVGDAMSATDGAIFVITAASTADDNVEVAATIRGDATKLGNPVDISFDGANLYVAEKSNSSVLRYDAILGLTGNNNTAENAMIEVANPESVALAFTQP